MRGVIRREGGVGGVKRREECGERCDKEGGRG